MHGSVFWSRVRSNSDFFSGLIFVGIGLAAAIGSFSYDMGTLHQMGPGLVPLIVSLMLAVLGAAIIVGAIDFSSRPQSEKQSLSIAWRPLIVVTLSVVAVGATLERFGLLVALAGLVAILGLARGGLTLKLSLLLYVVLIGISAVVFIFGLGLRIPLTPW